jgi:hypothetical protein
MISLIATRAPIEMGNKYHRDGRAILLSSRPEYVPFQCNFRAVRLRWLQRSTKFLRPARRMIGDENIS